jgi:hypothetical protein
MLHSIGDENGLKHASVERCDEVTRRVLLNRVMKGADYRGVATSQDSGDSPATPAVRPGRRKVHQHLVALHGAVYLVGRDKNVIVATRLASLGTHEPETLAMHIQPAGNQIVVGGCHRESPMIRVGLDQLAPRRQSTKLFQQQPAFPAPAETKFTNQLLVSGSLTRGPFDSAEQLAVSHCTSNYAVPSKAQQTLHLC